MNRRRPAVRRPAAGFSLIELLVSLAVFVGLLVAVLSIFNVNMKFARVQTNVTDMQQSLRIVQHELVRMVRMAGRGGLPRGNLPDGLALEVESGVADGTTIGTGSPQPVLADTDILTVRGVFTMPYYQVNPAGGNFTIDNPPSVGSVRIQDPNPQTGVRQSLEELADAVEATPAVADALMLVSPLDDSIFAVVEVDPDASTVTRVGGVPTEVNLGFKVVDKYKPLSAGGDFPAALTNVAFVGVLEEYRFYVREAYAVAGDDTSELVPRLTMARFFPGTDDPYAGSADNLRIDLADNVLDFQVALALDTNDNSQIDENPANPELDEWLYNHGEDDEDEARWDIVPGSVPAILPDLYYVRITTVARTDRPDTQYVSPPLGVIEDRDHGEPVTPGADDLLQRRYRRWRLETLIDLRNI